LSEKSHPPRWCPVARPGNHSGDLGLKPSAADLRKIAFISVKANAKVNKHCYNVAVLV